MVFIFNLEKAKSENNKHLVIMDWSEGFGVCVLFLFVVARSATAVGLAMLPASQLGF